MYVLKPFQGYVYKKNEFDEKEMGQARLSYKSPGLSILRIPHAKPPLDSEMQENYKIT